MDTRVRKIEEPDGDETGLGLAVASNDIDERIIELQLKMATSSINHEYARIEYEDTADRERREELLDFMNDCHCQYLEARSQLITHDPYALQQFEFDLLRQKQATVSPYQI